MKTAYTVAALGLAAVLAGCTTSSKVQEMIDSSHRDYLDRIEAQQASIDVLKQSAMAGLEKSRENAGQLVELEKQLKQIVVQLDFIRDSANAAKVMSAANTVKVDDLEKYIKANKAATDEVLARMAAIDKLYEKVLIRQYQMVLESANAAIESLKADGVTASANVPVKMDKPIEIVAPDTSSAATNGMPE